MVENVRILLNPHPGETTIPPILYYDIRAPHRFYSHIIERRDQCTCHEILNEITGVKIIPVIHNK